MSMRRSILELVVGGVPLPHGLANGDWHYRHAVRPEGAGPVDYQVVFDFLAYEEAHGRTVSVVADPSLAGWEEWIPPEVRPHPGIYPKQCCSHVYPQGCTGRLVCHGTAAKTAARILQHGALVPGTTASGRSAEELARAGTWGDPADYFEHVMFANGSCTAPEAVAHSHQLRRDLVPTDLVPGYPPAVRFYFDWAKLAARPDACFDGVHLVKIAGEVPLASMLVVAVIHKDLWRTVADFVPTELADRMVVLQVLNPSPADWATAAHSAAERMLRGTG